MPNLSAPNTCHPPISKKIGNTIYKVSVHFSPTSTERVEDKILRLAKNDVLGLLELKSATEVSAHDYL
jgi:hypothetical protein